MTTDSRILQAKKSADIVALIGEHVTLTASRGKFQGLCPFHSENTPSFYVSPETGRFKCFGCGASGDVLSWCTNYLGMGFGEAVDWLIGDKPTDSYLTPSGFLPAIGSFEDRVAACNERLPPRILIRALLEPRIPKLARKLAYVDIKPYESVDGIAMIIAWFGLGEDTLGQYEALRLWEDIITQRWLPF